MVRGVHWGGCEIRSHWVRDIFFEENSTRSENVNFSGDLAILRGVLITLKARLVTDKFWPFIRELSSMKISLPDNMICKNPFKQKCLRADRIIAFMPRKRRRQVHQPSE